MNKINLDKSLHSLDEAKDRLRRLNMRRRELLMKKRIKMPMSDEEHHKLERIDVDIEQQEYFVEWIEDSVDDWD